MCCRPNPSLKMTFIGYNGTLGLREAFFLSDPPEITVLTVDPSGPVPDGSTVTLICSSNANPAPHNYTWYRVSPTGKEVMGSGQEISFKVTKLSEDQYYCEALNIHGMKSSKPASINVTCEIYFLYEPTCFPRILTKCLDTFSLSVVPEVLPSSGCVEIVCSCISLGNPPPSLVWKVSGNPVNHSADFPIKEIALGSSVMKSVINLTNLQGDSVPSLVCLSVNSQGFDSFTFHISSSVLQREESAESFLLLLLFFFLDRY